MAFACVTPFFLLSPQVYPGDTALAFYLAKNETNAPITGVATYNVNPLKGGLYFNKIQCFCFEEQRLQPNEEIEMPVFFFIDPEVENDARFSDVDKIILNYTFFPVEVCSRAPHENAISHDLIFDSSLDFFAILF